MRYKLHTKDTNRHCLFSTHARYAQCLAYDFLTIVFQISASSLFDVYTSSQQPPILIYHYHLNSKVLHWCKLLITIIIIITNHLEKKHLHIKLIHSMYTHNILPLATMHTLNLNTCNFVSRKYHLASLCALHGTIVCTFDSMPYHQNMRSHQCLDPNRHTKKVHIHLLDEFSFSV